MDMWCPYGIGRESWDRVVPRLVDQDPPLREISLAGLSPFAEASGSAHMRIVLVVLLVVWFTSKRCEREYETSAEAAMLLLRCGS